VLMAHYESERAESRFHEAMGLLERLLRAAEEGKRSGSVIEIMVLQARAHQMRSDVPAALAPLERALTLAEPEGYIQTFASAGRAMSVLVSAIADHGGSQRYVGRLLTAIEKTADTTPAEQVLVDPLSQRERHVLRLLGTDLSGPQIARELIVSLSTVRTHTSSVYAKLGVNNRRAAVRRAAELDL
jgi:LuxR family transcriptional regulator, maltose regulon positive regulatory protein